MNEYELDQNTSDLSSEPENSRKKVLKGILLGDKPDYEQFKRVRNSIENDFSILEQEAQELANTVKDLRLQVLSFRKLALKALKNVLGVKVGKIDNQARDLKDFLDRLKVQIPQFLQKLVTFVNSVESRLKEIKITDDELYSEVEYYRRNILNRVEGLKQMIGPLSSQLLTIGSTYVNALKKVENIKKAINLAKKMKTASTVASSAPAWIPIVIVVVLVLTGIIIIFAIQESTEQPVETIFENHCLITDSNNPDCLKNLIENSLKQQFSESNRGG